MKRFYFVLVSLVVIAVGLGISSHTKAQSEGSKAAAE